MCFWFLTEPINLFRDKLNNTPPNKTVFLKVTGVKMGNDAFTCNVVIPCKLCHVIKSTLAIPGL